LYEMVSTDLHGGVMNLVAVLGVVNSLVTLGFANTVATFGGFLTNVNIQTIY